MDEFKNSFYQVATQVAGINKQRTEGQMIMIDNFTMNAPMLKSIPFQKASHSYHHAYGDVVDVRGMQIIDFDAPLPTMQVETQLKSVNLTPFGGALKFPEDMMKQTHGTPEKRHKNAREQLWTFQFDHAGSSVQQQMARKGFFKAHNQFEGARNDEERDEALQDMQNMYSKIDKRALEIPVWNGFLNTTAGAIESDSIAAQELQERMLNNFNSMLNNVEQLTVLQKAMQAALQQVVKNTDPNQQPYVGGYV